MKLNNDFSEYVKSVFWTIRPYCWKCGSNQNCSIHHIFGRVSSSIYNGILLCDKHHRIADNFNKDNGQKGEKVRLDLMIITFSFLFKDPFWQDYLDRKDRKSNQIFIVEKKDYITKIRDKLYT